MNDTIFEMACSDDNYKLTCCSREASGVISIPDGVTIIGTSAFANCTLLTEVHIPESVRQIEQRAFENCCSLENLVIPQSVDIIGSWAFKGCLKLKQIVINNPNIHIKDNSFLRCPVSVLRSIERQVPSVRRRIKEKEEEERKLKHHLFMVAMRRRNK